MADLTRNMGEALERLVRQPYAPLIPWAGVVVLLVAAWTVSHLAVVAPVHARLQQLEDEWGAERSRLVHHMEARRVLLDLEQVLAAFPLKEDFVPMALAITEEAKRNNVTLPSLTYSLDRSKKTEVATRAVFHGAVKGRYEDLRRFIHRLEATEEPLFIEDLDVMRSGSRQGDILTFQMRIATYLRTAR